MKLIALFLALAILPIQKSFTGSPDASTRAPQFEQGVVRYFNLTPGGQQGNLVIVKENGLPGMWNNATAQWQILPGGVRELFFATANQFYYTNLEGHAGFGRIQPGFEKRGPYDSATFSCPFTAITFYPSREDVQYIWLQIGGRWAVRGVDGFVVPADAPRKPADESNADYVMRQFRKLDASSMHMAAQTHDNKGKGVYVTLTETPYAGPYYLPGIPADGTVFPEYGIFGVKDGVLTLACAEFYCWEDDGFYWYEDFGVEPPYIPLNMVTRYAAGFDGIKGTDGGVFYGTKEDACYGLHLRPDGSYKFGKVYLHINSDGTYTPFGHSDWWEDDWRFPMDLSFREFYFDYEFQFYRSDPEYDVDAVWEKAKKIYLKANNWSEFTERYPMSTEGYDNEKGALKLVFAEDIFPPVFVPMSAKDAENLLRDIKKYGTDELVWWYSRGIDEEGYLYASHVSVGWPVNWPGQRQGRIFEYIAE